MIVLPYPVEVFSYISYTIHPLFLLYASINLSLPSAHSGHTHSSAVFQREFRCDLSIRIAKFRNIFIAAAAADISLPIGSGLGGVGRFIFTIEAPAVFLRYPVPCEERKNLIHIAHNAVIAVFKDRSAGILVDGNDGGSIFDSFQMLHRAGNTTGNVQITDKLLTGHTHVAVKRYILESFRHRTGRAMAAPLAFARSSISFMFSLLPIPCPAETTRSAWEIGVSIGIPTVKSWPSFFRCSTSSATFSSAEPSRKM